MENLVLKAANPTINKSKTSKIKTRRTYLTASVVCFGGGLVFSIAGLLLPFALMFSQKNNGIFNYGGTFLLIISLLLFGSCAHFMDKADDGEKKSKKL